MTATLVFVAGFRFTVALSEVLVLLDTVRIIMIKTGTSSNKNGETFVNFFMIYVYILVSLLKSI